MSLKAECESSKVTTKRIIFIVPDAALNESHQLSSITFLCHKIAYTCVYTGITNIFSVIIPPFHIHFHGQSRKFRYTQNVFIRRAFIEPAFAAREPELNFQFEIRIVISKGDRHLCRVDNVYYYMKFCRNNRAKILRIFAFFVRVLGGRMAHGQFRAPCLRTTERLPVLIPLFILMYIALINQKFCTYETHS